MVRGAGVVGGVLGGRGIAAESDAALLAGAEVDPLPADLDALSAFPPLGVADGVDRGEVGAGGGGHGGVTLIGG